MAMTRLDTLLAEASAYKICARFRPPWMGCY